MSLYIYIYMCLPTCIFGRANVYCNAQKCAICKNACMCEYLHLYICMYAYIYMHIYIYIYIYICRFVYMHVTRTHPLWCHAISSIDVWTHALTSMNFILQRKKEEREADLLQAYNVRENGGVKRGRERERKSIHTCECVISHVWISHAALSS